MKIVKLQAENIKRLTAVEIEPNGSVVQITGRNGQGKTSILDCIWMALGGKSAAPEQPVHQGAEKGTIRLDLGDIIVRRSFTAKGTSLIVENKDGARYPSPQSMLDHLIGRLSFDPLGFMRMEPRKQLETLRAVTGVDVSELQERRKCAYDARRDVNRDLERAQVELDAISVDESAPLEEVDVASIREELRAAEETNRLLNESNQKLTEIDNSIASAEMEIKRLQLRIEQLKANRSDLESEKPAQYVDTDAIWARLNSADDHNEVVRKARQDRANRDERAARVKDLSESSADLTKTVQDIDSLIAQAIESADMPVPGLAFGDGEVLYNGLPLSQASGAEQLRVSVAMAMAINPDLRVLRITDGSLLDSDSLAMIESLANDHDYQVWIESVDESGKVGIYIEDGAVRAVNGEPVEEARHAEQENEG